MSSFTNAAEHVDDGIDFADTPEELVAEPLALAGAGNQSTDSRNSTVALTVFFDLLISASFPAFVGNLGRPDVGSFVANGYGAAVRHHRSAH